MSIFDLFNCKNPEGTKNVLKNGQTLRHLNFSGYIKVVKGQAISAQERRQELLNDDIKYINKLSIHKQRAISEDFEENKTRWVKEAKKSGAENPEQEIYSHYRQRINNIKSEQEYSIKQAHEKHCINYNPQNFLTQKFNHEM